jgi:glycosyltransferase involved in cell wall biosynthesis
MIRILHVVCYPELYGTQRSLLSTVRCLDRTQFEPFVAAPANPEFRRAVRHAGAAMDAAPMRNALDMASAAALRKIIRGRGIHLVHAHLGISSFLATAAAASLGVPVVLTRHFIEDRYAAAANPLKRMAYVRAYQWINARARRIICVSQAVCDAVIAREKPDPSKCLVIPNGVRIPDETKETGHGTAQAWALPFAQPAPPRRMVACIARLCPEKGVDILLHAAAECVQSGLDICVAIAGQGPLRADLERLIVSLGLGGRVHLAGFIHNIPDLLNAADMFVLPALNEPFGISLVEAMAASLPVVASASGGPLEIIEPGISGLLTPPGDSAALAAAMRDILCSPEKAHALALGARQRAALFDERRTTRRVEQVYREALQ